MDNEEFVKALEMLQDDRLTESQLDDLKELIIENEMPKCACCKKHKRILNLFHVKFKEVIKTVFFCSACVTKFGLD